MVKLIQKNRERPVIIERIQMVITPMLNQLREEVRHLDKKEYGWNYRAKRMDNISSSLRVHTVANFF